MILHVLVEHVDHVFLRENRERAEKGRIERLEFQSRENQRRVFNGRLKENYIENHGQENNHKGQKVENHAHFIQIVQKGQNYQPRVAPIENDKHEPRQQIDFNGNDPIEKQETHDNVENIQKAVDNQQNRVNIDHKHIIENQNQHEHPRNHFEEKHIQIIVHQRIKCGPGRPVKITTRVLLKSLYIAPIWRRHDDS